MPSICIVIPLYNSLLYLNHTIESVLAQDYSDWHLVLVDDGSTDATPDVIAEWTRADGRISSVKQVNQGIAAARNRGFGECASNSEYVMFLDHDDVLEPNALSILLPLIATPRAGGILPLVAHGQPHFIGANGESLPSNIETNAIYRRKGFRQGKSRNIPWTEATDFSVLVYQNCIISPGTALIRSSAFAETGGFDATIWGVDDYDLWLRLSLHGPFATTTKTILAYRVHASNASRKLRRMYDNELATRSKFMARSDTSEEQRSLNYLALVERYLFAGLDSNAPRQLVVTLMEALLFEKVYKGMSVRWHDRHPLLMYALDYDLELVDTIASSQFAQLLTRSRPSGATRRLRFELITFSPAERLRLMRAMKRLLILNVVGRWQATVHFLKHRRPGDAARHLYYAILGIGTLVFHKRL